MQLADLVAGQQARVAQMLDMDPAVRKKLLALGLIPDGLVQFVRRAPLGDPIQIRIGSSQFSIRQALAEKILVELQP
ncbi:FeoA family protein [Bacterioplanoides sp.]|uniref:FeoA family protein n=1 Tax=Bacterioplanoides sp. TaxID=2066072 RepID=UPI003B5BEF4D